jgi:hypothetical protein
MVEAGDSSNALAESGDSLGGRDTGCHRVRAVLPGTFGTFSLGAADWLLVVTLALTIVRVLATVKSMERQEWFEELV